MMRHVFHTLRFSAVCFVSLGTVQAVLIPNDLGMGEILTKLSEAGLNITLPSEALETAATGLKYYDKIISYDKTCPSDATASFGQSEAQEMITSLYTEFPFNCMNSLSSREATAGAFANFGYDTGSLATENPMSLAVECILQETVDSFDTSWSTSNTASLGSLEKFIAYERSKVLWSINQPVSAVQDAYFPEFKSVISSSIQLALNPLSKDFAMSEMSKYFLIYVAIGGFIDSSNYKKLVFYANIEWAVNLENVYNPSKENVLVGQKLLKLLESCIHFTKSPANGDFLPRFLSMYTLWNYRFLKFYFSKLDPDVQLCKVTTGNSDAYEFSTQVLHAFQSLAQSISLGSISGGGWMSTRVKTLLATGVPVIACNGSVSFLPLGSYKNGSDTLATMALAMSGNPTARTSAFQNGDACGVTSRDFLNYDFRSDWMVAGEAGCTLGEETGCFCAPDLEDGESKGAWKWQCNNVVNFGPHDPSVKSCPDVVPVGKDLGPLYFGRNRARALETSGTDAADLPAMNMQAGAACDTAIHPTGHPGDEVCPYSDCDEGGDHSAICACIDREQYGMGVGMEWVCMHATCRCSHVQEEAAGPEEAASLKTSPDSSADAVVASAVASFSVLAMGALWN